MERNQYSPPKENLITKINYSERAKAALGLAFFGAGSFIAFSIDRGVVADAINLPNMLRGRLYDSFGPICYALGSKLLLGQDEFELHTAAGTVPIAIEVGQLLHIRHGTFDPGDFAAYGVGLVGWVAYDKAAKALYDSGITKPLYRVLGIQDRRIEPWKYLW